MGILYTYITITYNTQLIHFVSIFLPSLIEYLGFLCSLPLELISSSCWVYCCPSWAEIPQTNLSLSPTVLSECCLHLLLAKWPKLCKNCCLWKHTEDTWKKTRTLFVTKLHMPGMLMGVDTENVPEYSRWYVRWLLATSFNRMMLTPLCNSWNSEWTTKF